MRQVCVTHSNKLMRMDAVQPPTAACCAVYTLHCALTAGDDDHREIAADPLFSCATFDCVWHWFRLMLYLFESCSDI